MSIWMILGFLVIPIKLIHTMSCFLRFLVKRCWKQWTCRWDIQSMFLFSCSALMSLSTLETPTLTPEAVCLTPLPSYILLLSPPSSTEWPHPQRQSERYASTVVCTTVLSKTVLWRAVAIKCLGVAQFDFQKAKSIRLLTNTWELPPITELSKPTVL